MLKEELRKRARSIVHIPPHYHPVIEDILQDDKGRGEALFIWADEDQEEEISITLDLKGNVTDLSIDKKYEDTVIHPATQEEKRKIAEEFLRHHDAHALNFLTLSKVTNQSLNDIFYYEQLVMGLPLENAGCRIVIDHWGNVTGFTYKGIKPTPEIPEILIEKEKLIADVKQRLDFALEVRQQETGDFRLVYEPTIGRMDYNAGILEPTLTIIPEEDEDIKPTFIPLALPSQWPERESSIEEIVGISADMEVIREKDMGDEWGVVWRWKNWEGKDQDLTINSFFANHNDDTVKAFIHKETGEVTRFIWFYERKGELQLTREECLAIATEFLQKMIPEYCPYLQLRVTEDEADNNDEQPTLSAFTFWFYTGKGIPFHSEIIMVGVNPTTGQINHYSGPSFKLEQLKQIPAEPAITKEQARERFLQHLDFKLAWHYNYETESYFLAYEACDRETQSAIQNIDAMTGEVITYQDLF